MVAMRIWLLAIFAVLAGGEEGAPAPTVFTAAQAEAGKAAYLDTCVTCHGESLIPAAGAMYGKQLIPPLAWKDFLATWGPQTTGDLSRRVKVAIGGFPPKGSDEQTHLILTAYILQVSGARSGDRPLTNDSAVPIDKATGAKGKQDR